LVNRGEFEVKKKLWGDLRKKWVEPDIRDEVVEYIMELRGRTGKGIKDMVRYIGISRQKFYDWERRLGIGNMHNGKIPKSHWLMEEEKKKIKEYARENYGEGYRRLAYMMIDGDIVYVSPSSVYRELKAAGLLGKGVKVKKLKKGRGYKQPEGAHKEWHIDISYIKIGKIWFFLIAVIDGYTRYIVSWDLRGSIEERDVEIVLQKAHEAFPDARPRIISDRGSQFIAREFKEYIMEVGFKHTLISVGYPQANGKMERFFRTAKEECIIRNIFLTQEEAREVIGKYIEYYNNRRLHSAIGYITPKDMLEGRREDIWKERDRKLEEGRKKRIDVYKRTKEGRDEGTFSFPSN
jgi:transposase InsO family protein